MTVTGYVFCVYNVDKPEVLRLLVVSTFGTLVNPSPLYEVPSGRAHGNHLFHFDPTDFSGTCQKLPAWGVVGKCLTATQDKCRVIIKVGEKCWSVLLEDMVRHINCMIYNGSMVDFALLCKMFTEVKETSWGSMECLKRVEFTESFAKNGLGYNSFAENFKYSEKLLVDDAALLKQMQDLIDVSKTAHVLECSAADLGKADCHALAAAGCVSYKKWNFSGEFDDFVAVDDCLSEAFDQ
jgi:hypothetical protein